MARGHDIAVDAQSSFHAHGAIGIESYRHALRLRSSHLEREIPKVGRSTHDGLDQSTRDGGRRVWRIARQRDGNRILVAHRLLLQTISESRVDAKGQSHRSLGEELRRRDGDDDVGSVASARPDPRHG